MHVCVTCDRARFEAMRVMRSLTTWCARTCARRVLLSLYQVLCAHSMDSFSSISLRCHILSTLGAVLHLPEAMAQFVGEASKSESATHYQSLAQSMLEPMQPMLVAPVQRILAMAHAWEAGKELREESERALRAQSQGVQESDKVCAPLLRALGEFECALHSLTASHAPTSDERPVLLPTARGDRVERASSCSLPYEGARSAGSPLSARQIKLMNGAGMWHSVLAILASSCVRASR